MTTCVRNIAIAIAGLLALGVTDNQYGQDKTNPLMAADSGQTAAEATSLFGQPLYRKKLTPEQSTKLEEQLRQAQDKYERDPNEVENIIWLGRRLAYLWRYNDAIRVFSDGIAKYPDNPKLLRHRGHRYITLRKFDLAVADLEKAVEIIANQPDEVEPDGQPNKAGIPTSTLHTNIWYHLGLAYYLQGQFDRALAAFEKCLAASQNDDMRVATLDWMYMALRRLNRHADAAKLAESIKPDLKILENHAYHRRLLMYSRQLKPADLLVVEQSEDPDLDVATYGYGLGNWHLMEGDLQEAINSFRRVIDGPYWPAFGYIAAESDLRRLGSVPTPDK